MHTHTHMSFKVDIRILDARLYSRLSPEVMSYVCRFMVTKLFRHLCNKTEGAVTDADLYKCIVHNIYMFS